MKSQSTFNKVALIFFIILIITGLGIYYGKTRSCENYPMLSNVEEILIDQNKLIQQIQNAAPEYIEVFAEEIHNCEGRGQVIIIYSTLNGKNKILQLLPNPKTFFGVPIKFRNV